MIVFRLICRLFLKKPAVIHFLIRLRMRKAAGSIFYAAFDRWAPRRERLAASDKAKRRKWNKLGACEYLLHYQPMAAAAILNQLYSHPERGANAWIVLNICLSHPDFAGNQERMDKIGEIGEIIAESNAGLTEDFLRNGSAQAAVNFLDIVDVPPVPGILLRLSKSHTAYLLYQLRRRNRQRYEALFQKLNADYASFVKKENFNRTKENLLDKLSDMNEENLRKKLDDFLRTSAPAPGRAGAGAVKLAEKEPS